jgi:hypothetical protein
MGDAPRSIPVTWVTDYSDDRADLKRFLLLHVPADPRVAEAERSAAAGAF